MPQLLEAEILDSRLPHHGVSGVVGEERLKQQVLRSPWNEGALLGFVRRGVYRDDDSAPSRTCDAQSSTCHAQNGSDRFDKPPAPR